MLPPSEIARAAGLKTHPVAIVWTDKKPEKALEFRPGTWGCIMWFFAKVATDGKTAVFSRETTTCAGGCMGIGFGRPLEKHAARNEDGFCSFLSNGIAGAADKKAYQTIIDQSFDDHHKKMLTEGERFLKNPSVVKKWLQNLPVYDAKDLYIVMKPVTQADPNEEIKSIVFVVNADQLAALSTLANFATGNVMNGIFVAASAAGCQAMGVCTYAEGESATPRAVVGLTDLSARKAVRPTLGKDVLTFSVPYALYREMEQNVKDSCLELDLWKELRDTQVR